MEIRISFLSSFAVLVILHILGCLTAGNGMNIDQSSLVSLKTSITIDPNQSIVKNWSINTPVCSWIGVTCNPRHHRVSGLNLPNMGLVGRIPPQLGNLSFLVYLNLSGNSFHGELPGELAHLRLLEIMDFRVNFFSGRIPSSLSLLPKLQELILADNSFTGVIPQTLLNISTLQALILDKNSFSDNLPEDICRHVPLLVFLSLASNNLNGTIPSDISGCKQLQILALEKNNLTGPIPREIGNLTMLKHLYLDGNNLQGFIPKEIGSLYALEIINLSQNRLRGSIPPSLFNISTLRMLGLTGNNLLERLPANIGNGMPNLEHLYLDLNNLSGVIPDTISNYSKLKTLDLSANEFTGLVPKTLGNLRFLQILGLNENNLESDQELSFITSLTRCSYLTELTVGANPLNGILPAAIGNISNLEIIDATYCGIKGIIARQIGNLSSLIILSLSHNYLTGSVPPEFSGLQKLQGLYFNFDSLSGTIPVNLCHLKYLTSLYLINNQIVGVLPECIGNLTSLRNLYLGSNKLTSSIPTSLWKLKDMMLLNLTSNLLSGYLPPEIANLQAVNVFDLSKNQLSGYIPDTVSKMRNLVNLSLADNKFDGPIPNSIGALKSLEMLDLSNNSLTGMLPMSLEALQYLTYFNVSFNKLTGDIPSGGPFENLSYLSFMSNEALCGIPQFHVPPCQSVSVHSSRNKKVLLAVVTPITIVVAITLVIILVLSRYRTRQAGPQADSSLNTVPERISYNQLQQATDGFSDSNLLGSGSFGSVFRALFTDGTLAAIKVFHFQSEGALRSFETECEVLRSIRHRNLTKVISSCSNLDFKALVLEYMPNGNLEKWMYSDGHFLDAIQRLNIMIDVAHGIEYLHHGYSTVVVHCDLKPSNVLLDQDMVGHVTDFGIAKLLGEEEVITHTSTIATIGYIAPEYGAEGLVSASCDVYSYGILLMETFTRRRPTDEMFSGDLSLRSWVTNSLPSAIDRVVDANLISTGKRHLSEMLNCISSLMSVAVNCSAESPDQRPSMKHVVISLKKIKIQFLAHFQTT